MKIRLFGDSVRVRLTQVEVEALAGGGAIETIIAFPGEALVCILEASDGVIDAHHAAGRITIQVPRERVAEWACSAEEGMYGSSGVLRIAMEKDYRCIHKPDSPDNVGTFPNPLAPADLPAIGTGVDSGT